MRQTRERKQREMYMRVQHTAQHEIYLLVKLNLILGYINLDRWMCVQFNFLLYGVHNLSTKWSGVKWRKMKIYRIVFMGMCEIYVWYCNMKWTWLPCHWIEYTHNKHQQKIRVARQSIAATPPCVVHTHKQQRQRRQ